MANHGDLADVIAVVGDHLGDNGFKRARYIFVAFVCGFDLATQFVWRQLRQSVEFGDTPGHIPLETIPQFCIERRIRRRKALCSVSRILWTFAADAVKFIAHPVIHVEDELGDAVRKSGNVIRGKFRGEVYYARDWIDVCAFSVEEFDEDLGHLCRRDFRVGLNFIHRMKRSEVSRCYAQISGVPPEPVS